MKAPARVEGVAVRETTGERWWTDEGWQVSTSNNQLRTDLGVD